MICLPGTYVNTSRSKISDAMNAQEIQCLMGCILGFLCDAPNMFLRKKYMVVNLLP